MWECLHKPRKICNTVAYLLRRDMMTKAVVDTKALQVVSQENMLENLLHSEVKTIRYNTT